MTINLSIAQMQPNILPYLKTRYPGAKIDKIKQDKNGYTAGMTNNGKKCSVYFNRQGSWLRTETNLKWKTMPAATKVSLNRSQYAGWQVLDTKEEEIASTETGRQTDTLYMFEVNNSSSLGDMRSLAQTSDKKIYFNAAGKLVKEEKIN